MAIRIDRPEPKGTSGGINLTTDLKDTRINASGILEAGMNIFELLEGIKKKKQDELQRQGTQLVAARGIANALGLEDEEVVPAIQEREATPVTDRNVLGPNPFSLIGGGSRLGNELLDPSGEEVDPIQFGVEPQAAIPGATAVEQLEEYYPKLQLPTNVSTEVLNKQLDADIALRQSDADALNKRNAELYKIHNVTGGSALVTGSGDTRFEQPKTFKPPVPKVERFINAEGKEIYGVINRNPDSPNYGEAEPVPSLPGTTAAPQGATTNIYTGDQLDNRVEQVIEEEFAEQSVRSGFEQTQKLLEVGMTNTTEIVPQLQNMLGVIDRIRTHKLTSVGTAIAGFFDSFGITLDDTLPDKQIFDAGSAQLRLQMRNPKSGGGLTGNTTDKDLVFLGKGVAGLEKTTYANKVLIQSAIFKAQRTAAIGELANAYLYEHLNLGPGFNILVKQFLSENDLTNWIKGSKYARDKYDKILRSKNGNPVFIAPDGKHYELLIPTDVTLPDIPPRKIRRRVKSKKGVK